MARYEIIGGTQLNGSITISGAKNAAVAILPAALLVEGKCRIENVPDISSYEVIYVGSPIYWGGMPEELFTALKGVDYSGKIIVKDIGKSSLITLAS